MPPISVNDLIKFQIKMKFQLGRISLLLWEKGIQYGSIVFYWQKKKITITAKVYISQYRHPLLW